MLTAKCIHPQLLGLLSALGHGDKILIADGNYPLTTKTGASPVVWLGLSPGMPTVTDVLKVLSGVVNFERAEVMAPDDGSQSDIYAEFQTVLGGMPLEGLPRRDFYARCCDGSLSLAISTGETRVYANILLTIGVA